MPRDNAPTDLSCTDCEWCRGDTDDPARCTCEPSSCLTGVTNG